MKVKSMKAVALHHPNKTQAVSNRFQVQERDILLQITILRDGLKRAANLNQHLAVELKVC